MNTTATQDPRAVLVYGTLRPGFHNYGLVADLAHDVETAAADGYALWIPRHRGFPYAWPNPDGTVNGERLQFHEDDWPEALRRMDRLEGHPVHYCRRVVETTAGPAWLYVATEHPMDAYGASLSLTGDWTNESRNLRAVR